MFFDGCRHFLPFDALEGVNEVAELVLCGLEGFVELVVRWKVLLDVVTESWGQEFQPNDASFAGMVDSVGGVHDFLFEGCW